jgi:DNA-binding NtrC family response regulator
VDAVEVGSEAASGRGGADPQESVVLYRTGMRMSEVERAAVEAALRDTRGNRRKAAELLGIGERTLYRKLKEYEIGGDDPSSQT